MPETTSTRRTDHPPARRRGSGGRLKIGDEWMAIQIVARSQANPQKAVAELVENSLDAGATRVTLTRGRRRGKVFLRVSDNGRGIPLTPEGIPDFDYVATHICDSLKRRLDERQRAGAQGAGVQGEFGIGLLGFWSIGKDLEMISQTGHSPAWMMLMRAGSRHYDKRRYLGRRTGDGVDVTIHEVHREAQSRLTAEKLQRYLGEELRQRIRRAGAIITLEDRLPPRRTLTVQPAVFRGKPIPELKDVPVPGRPPIRAELFLSPRDSDAASGERPGERPAVALYRLGTRVCRDLAELPEFAREPWTGGGLEGALDYPDFRLAPATREGFQPDEAYHAFVEAVRAIEPLLLERLRQEEEARSERASRSLVKELQSAFARLLRDLPAGEYDWFGASGPRPFAGGGDGRPGGDAAIPGGGPDAPEDVATRSTGGPAAEGLDESLAEGGLEQPGAAEQESPPPEPPALVSGPVETVSLRPEVVRVAVGRRRSVRAVSRDGSGLVIGRPLSYAWSLSPGVGSLIVEPGGVARIEAGLRPARGVLTVNVAEPPESGASRAVSADAEVLVEAEAPHRAFPPPVFVHAPSESWRSRWNASDRKLEVNTAHPDYVAVRAVTSRRRRYLGRLYAKELVLHNFGLEATPVVLERFLEVLTRLDEHL
jgi:hypothetical protein